MNDGVIEAHLRCGTLGRLLTSMIVEIIFMAYFFSRALFLILLTIGYSPILVLHKQGNSYFTKTCALAREDNDN